jgi:hypothetical protein
MAVNFGRLTIMIILICSVSPGESPSGVFSISRTTLTLTCFLFSPIQFPFLTKFVNDRRVFLSPVFPHLPDMFDLFLGTVFFFGKFSSPLGSNALTCCLRYGWSLYSFVLNLVQLSNSFFHLWYRGSLPDIVIYTAMSLLELIFLLEKVILRYLVLQNLKLLI